ncbi:aspartate kinase [Virgibacillus sp. MSP4-1]|uniref:aspartate kinase n=1 Tax=Virgibacillus sp. MSP4-1 TaxID=2700081 RepID=UPI0003999A33|nr:aspartate kinase [Virgibacillus sp. MSP4-1]QHS22303.1 aspartate kinase [Virgibacillus sp. MSP4-1]
MKLVVQKFGGTSVRSKDTRSSAISHIKKAMDDGYKVVIVVSAIGRQGDPYATDTLLSLVNDTHSYISDREKDLLVSCGETISSIVFSNELNEQNVKAAALTGAQAGFLTNSEFTNAKIERVNTDRILKELEVYDAVVVAGFQGKDENGETTTIGRGGSDTTAAALGAALKSEYVDIFTDVEGIMTADPRIVEKARPLSVVTYNEINNLAHQGAKVIHPRAVELAMQAEIPLRIRSTYSDDQGTLVTSSRTEANGQDIPDRLITGIAHLSDITQINVKSETNTDKLHEDVFTTMAEASISVDFINISPDGVTYTVPGASADHAVQLLQKMGYQPETVPNCAKVSTVGAGMTGVPGVTSKIVSSLAAEGIQILQSADSHTTIWVLIHEDDLKKAVTALHDTFELG